MQALYLQFLIITLQRNILLLLFYKSGYWDSKNLGKLPKIYPIIKFWSQDSNTGLIQEKKKCHFFIVVSCQFYYLLYKNSNKE